jgi:SAM-dependent methyltransferase
MEEFYALLRDYNRKLDLSSLPAWTKIYTEENPPTYWSELYKILSNLPRENSILEVGSGLGDIVALIKHLGFKSIKGIEKDEKMARIANSKYLHFFEENEVIENDVYPNYSIDSDILIMVNCVYFDGIKNKSEYLRHLKNYFDISCARYFILEVIDSSFKVNSEVFPEFVRIDRQDLEVTFGDNIVLSQITYEYPRNTSTKRIYLIKK